jgi:serine/threonine-protein kinase ULK4
VRRFRQEPALGICRALLARASEEHRLDAARGGRGGEALTLALDGVAPLLQLSPVLVECAAAGETEVAGSAIPQLAAESLRLMVELLPKVGPGGAKKDSRDQSRASSQTLDPSTSR